MRPLDVQFPHAETLVQCNTLHKNITEKTQIKVKKKVTQQNQSPILLTNTTTACNKQIHVIYSELHHLLRTTCLLQKAHAFVLPYDQ